MKVSTPRGMRDFFGSQMELRRKVKDNILNKYRLYGFEELDTPSFENFEIFTMKGGAGEAIKDEIYYFKDKSGRELGMRFDFTVPMSRFVAGNPGLAKPYKRFQIGKVWRYDRPGKGRYREFEQADADIIGVSGLIADTESIVLMSECIYKIGIKNAIIRLNSRKLAEGIVLQAGVSSDKVMDVFRSMDKLEKIGVSGVRKELKEERKLSSDQIDIILQLIDISGTNSFVLKELKSRITNDIGRRGLKDIEEILALLKNYYIKTKVQFDVSLVRGLEYYTGAVFECISESNRDIGSFCSGGRYDKLIGLYSGTDVPGVGFSFGIDRVCDILQKELMVQREGVFVAVLGDYLDEAVKVVSEVRGAGIKADVNYLERNLGNQLKYADNKGYKFVFVLGENEIAKKTVNVKDLSTGETKAVKRLSLKKFLDGNE